MEKATGLLWHAAQMYNNDPCQPIVFASSMYVILITSSKYSGQLIIKIYHTKAIIFKGLDYNISLKYNRIEFLLFNSRIS